MTLPRLLFLSASALVLFSRALFAQRATQTVTYAVDAINQIAVTGSPSLLARGGQTVQASGGTWAITTNQNGAKVAASIGADLPSGVTLSAQLGAPSGASSAGLRSLSTTSVDLVTGITRLNVSGLSLTYQLEASASAGVLNATHSVVTYTITGGA